MPTDDQTPSNPGQPAAQAADLEALIAKRLAEELPKVVNAALTSHLKRADIGGQIARALEPIKKALDTRTADDPGTAADVDPAIDPSAAGGAASTPKPRGQQPPKQPDPEAIELRKKIEDLEKARKEDQRLARAAARRAAETKGYSDLRAALATKVLPDAVDAVVDMLKGGGRVTIDEEGNPKLKIRAALEAGLPIEEHELPLDEALPHFLKSPAAKLFLPPPGTNQQTRRSPPTPTTTRAPMQQSTIASRPSQPTLADDMQASFESEHGPLADHI